MRIDFPYAGYEAIAPFDAPDERLMGVFSPRAENPAEGGVGVERALRNPIGAPPLRDAVRPHSRVLILVDDYTRGTPVPCLLSHVLRELAAAGVDDDGISLLTAQGTHRAMTHRELGQKLGAAP